MERRRNIAGGLVLILLGIFFLIGRSFPGLLGNYSWPLIIIGVGACFLLAAGLFRIGPLAIPGFVIGGIGSILYYQHLSGDWASWSYIWSLIPGFVGFGIVVSGLITSNLRGGLRPGLTLIGISLFFLVIFGGVFGVGWSFEWVFPVLLIGGGVSILVRAFFRR
jgi:hypothetical protein